MGSGGAGSAPPLSGPDDAIESYLEDRALKGALAAQLRRRLADAQGPARSAVAERLGKLYVEQLAAANTPDERQRIETHCQELLKSVPDADTFELRIDLAKTNYLRAEELAEQERLRRATPEERQEAERILKSVLVALSDIAAKVGRRVETLERKELSGSEEEGLKAELDEARRLRSLARYYAGWAGYYTAFISSSPQAAVRAVEDFGYILNAAPGRPASIDRVSRQMLQYEHVARAAIGCAMCASLRGNDAEALRWLDLVQEAEKLPQPVADQLFSRRLVVLAAAQRWADVELLVRRRRQARPGEGPTVLSPLEARLLAVVALDALGDGKSAARSGDLVAALAQVALGDLVTSGQVGHVLELVQRYGTTPIGQDGFIVRYVRALQAFERAREKHRTGGADPEQPTDDAAVAGLYKEAAALLQLACDSPDGARFEKEQVNASMRLGLAFYLAGDLEAASERFQKTAERTNDPQQKQDAMWYAIVALDRAVDGGKVSLARTRDRTAALFLQQFPRSENAARLLLRRAGAGLLPDDQLAQVLLEVPSASPLYLPARRHAATVLFRIYRKSGTDSRAETGGRFMTVAEEVLGIESREVLTGNASGESDAAQSIVRTARQIAEVGVSLPAPEYERAAGALNRLDDVASVLRLDLAPVQDEILFRRVQIGLGTGNTQAADQAIATLRTRPGPFQAAADRLMLRHVVKAWRAGGESAERAQAVVTSGLRVVQTFGAMPDLSKDAGALTVMNDVAEAAAEIWRLTSSEASRDIAIRLDRASTETGKPAPGVLRRLAVLSEQAGDVPGALDAWRTLLAGLPTDSGAWFEARYESARLLAKTDPAAALEVLRQHAVLYPSLGPDPWGPKLKELAESLGVTGPAEQPSKGGDK